MVFNARINVPPGFSQGQGYFVQTVKKARNQTLNSGQGQHSPNYGEWGLDNTVPYNDRLWATNAAEHTQDSPQNGLAGITMSSINDDFEMWVMFIAAGNSRPVPLGKVTWHVHAVANRGAAWTLDGSEAQSNSGFQRTADFPQWSLIHRNDAGWLNDAP